jgi:hypothetical protein
LSNKTLEIISNIPKNWLFVAIAIMVVLPVALSLPVPQPTPASFVQKAYDLVNALQPGDWVLWNQHLPPSATDELNTVKVVAEHLFERPGVKIVFLTCAGWGGETASLATEYYVTSLVTGIPKHGKVYGVDYMDLGWIPGDEAAVIKLRTSFRSVKEVDRYGTPFDSLPMIGPGVDLNFYTFTMTMGGVGVVSYAFLPNWRWWKSPVTTKTFGTTTYMPDVFITETGSMASAESSIAAGMTDGEVPGVPGGAMYEKLMGISGQVTAVSGVYVLLNTSLVILIIAGNVSYFVLRRRKAEVKK